MFLISKGTPEVAPEMQANVARLRDPRAMVNETHALDAHEFRATALCAGGNSPVAGSRQDEENQKSSTSLTHP